MSNIGCLTLPWGRMHRHSVYFRWNFLSGLLCHYGALSPVLGQLAPTETTGINVRLVFVAYGALTLVHTSATKGSKYQSISEVVDSNSLWVTCSVQPTKVPCRNSKMEHALHFFWQSYITVVYHVRVTQNIIPFCGFRYPATLLLLLTMPPGNANAVLQREWGRLWEPERGEWGCSPFQLSVPLSWVFYWSLWRSRWIELACTHCCNTKWFTMVFYCLS